MKWNKLLFKKVVAMAGVVTLVGSNISVTILEAKPSKVVAVEDKIEHSEKGRELLRPAGKQKVLIYSEDYEGEKAPEIKELVGTGVNGTIETGRLKVDLPGGEVIFTHEGIPKIQDGIMSFDFETTVAERISFMARISGTEFIGVGTDISGRWDVGDSSGWQPIGEAYKLIPNQKYHIQLEFYEEQVGYSIYDYTTQKLVLEGIKEVEGLPKQVGEVAFKSWFSGKTYFIDNLNIYEYREQEGIDKSRLEEAILRAEALNEAEYLPETWDVLKNQLIEAKQVMANLQATQSEVDEKTSKLEKAMSGLVKANRKIYEEHYSQEGQQTNWSNLEQASVQGGKLVGTVAPQMIAINEEAPVLKDGTYKFKIQADTEEIGVVCQYVDETDYVAIVHKGNGVWQLERGSEEPVILTEEGPVLLADQLSLIRIDSVDGKLDVYVNNRKVWSGDVSHGAGKIGVMNPAQTDANVEIDYLLAYELHTYYQNYEDTTQVLNWTTENVGYDNGWLKVNPAAVDTVFDENSPSIKEGTVELKFKTDASGDLAGGRYRVHYAGESAVAYDVNGNWVGFKNKMMQANTVYEMKIEFVGDSVRFWIDGEYLGAQPRTAAYGKFGIGSWYGWKTMWIDDVKIIESPNYKPEALEVNPQTISSEQLDVILDDKFPRVLRYEWRENDKVMIGQEQHSYGVDINSVTYYPEVESQVVGANQIEYTMKFTDIGVTIKSNYSVNENILEFKITEIEELGEVKVETISFVDQILISTDGSLTDATYASVLSNGGWFGVSDEIIENLSEPGSLKAGKSNATMAMVSGNGLAAAIENNVINGYDKIKINKSIEQGKNQVGIGNGAWTYRYRVNDEGQYPGLPQHEELPWFKVIVAEEQNNDGKVDWQDGAVAMKQIVNPVVGEDKMKNYHMYIPVHGESEGDTFLATLDYGKVLYNYTDGFGQMPLWKGYQVEGHDDSHPDYQRIGTRQGGAERFNYLINEGKKYNMDIGVHINATEFMLDAFETKMENLAGQEGGWLAPNWHWSEQAYYVDKNKDVLTGELERRLTALHDVAPDLSFIYVDVYEGNEYLAMTLKRIVNEFDWSIGTEFAGPLLPGAAFTHWGVDLNYPNKGNKSKVMRLVQDDLDIYSAHPLLKGQRMTGAGGWSSDGANNLKQTVQVFNEEILPGKYMQHFEMLKWEDKRIEFSNNVVSQVNNGRIELTKDGKLLAYWEDTTDRTHPEERHLAPATTLIPWNPITEDKLYHWNVSGESTVWEVPTSWEKETAVDVYRLDATEKTLIQTVEVIDGKITLDLEAKTPYIIYKQGEEPLETASNWGEGQGVADFGFESKSFDYWQKESNSSSTEHIQIKQIDNPLGSGKARNYTSYLEIGEEDAVVSQEITGLEPGKAYTVGVFGKVSEGREATLEVEIDGKVYSKTLTVHDLIQTGYYNHAGTTAVDLSVDFSVPDTFEKAVIRLKANSGAGTVEFDDVIVFEHANPLPEREEEYVVYEDFEDVHRSFGIFTKGKDYSIANLSEKDTRPDATQPIHYVLDGKWSVKAKGEGEILRTNQATLELKPNTTYEMGMVAYSGPGIHTEVEVKSRKNPNDVVMKQEMAKGSAVGDIVQGSFEVTGEDTVVTFTTGEATDYYVAINARPGEGQQCHEHSLFLDNFYVKEVKEEIEEAYTVLNGEAEVTSGRSFEVKLALEGLEDKAYAGDFIVEYDPQIFEFIGVEGISPTLKVQDEIETGKVRILTATEGGLENGKETLAFKFMAKRTDELVEGKIQIHTGTVGTIVESQSQVVDVLGTQKHISVKPITEEVDKVELQRTIAEAEKLSLEAVVGELPGQYPEAAKQKLDVAIISARQIEVSSKNQLEIDQAVSVLRSAISEFEQSVNKGEVEDINQDGKLDIADLALVAYYYHQKEADNPEWEWAQCADVNKDKVIDITDLSMVAQAILK